MVIERKKRTATREERQRNVKPKGALPLMECIIVTSMEPVAMDIFWSQRRQREFRTAHMYGFLKFLQRLPPIDIALLTEYLKNYDPEDGSSMVHGRIIGIDEVTLNKVLYLPMGELPVSGDLESDFVPSKYFKSGNETFEKNQGWKTSDALTPELGEWMRFVQKRLGLNRHSTYMARRLLFSAITTLEGMVFNWAAYVATRIHTELDVKRRTWKVTTMLCSNYMCEAIRYQLKQPSMVERLDAVAIEIRVESTPLPSKQVEEAAIAECSQGRNYERTNVSSSSRELGRPNTNMAVTPPVLVEYYQRVGLSGAGQQARELKELISAQITQLQMAVEKMDNEFSLRQETQAEWAKENKLAKSLMELTKQECMELRNQYQEEKNRVAELEAWRSKLEDDFWRQSESSKTKNEQLKRKITELEVEMITVTTQQGEVNPASTSLRELEKQVHALEEQLKERDTQIALLESQVGEGVGEEAQEVETNLTYGNDETDQGGPEVQTLEEANDVVILKLGTYAAKKPKFHNLWNLLNDDSYFGRIKRLRKKEWGPDCDSRELG
uniref:Predicted protein n=1 Tax=Physcomitrium patens TaxID=3218 RepID=A9U5K7_PHYPA